MTSSELLERLRARNGLPSAAERRRIRLEAGASIRDVAREVGVSTMSVQRWETGACEPGQAAAAYARLLEELERIGAARRATP